MQEITERQLEKSDFLLFIHTPFCGTCKIAGQMLKKIETMHQKELFYDMNAPLFPEFMQKAKVESVPCLLIMKNGLIQEKVYAFQSVANIYRYLLAYEPELVSV